MARNMGCACLLAVMLLGLAATPLRARELDVGPGRAYPTVSAAAAAAADGDHILIDGGKYFDCAVLAANHLTVEGRAPDAAATLTDRTCEDKAILVVTGHDVTLRNLTLARARVPDGNGAGVRAEGANLTADHLHLVNNQDGILGGDVPGSTVTIEDSVFTGNGVCNPVCAHAIYVNHVALVRVLRSVFRDTHEGHDVKSRAARTEVISCDIKDGPEGTASYLIEAPNGGALIVRDNVLEKGPRSGNHTAAISIGAEGVTQDTPEITITGNRLTNDGDYRTALVSNITATPATLQGNILTGAIDPLRGDGSVK